MSEAEAKTASKRPGRIWDILLIAALCVFAFSSYKFVSTELKYRAEKAEFERLAAQAAAAEEAAMKAAQAQAKNDAAAAALLNGGVSKYQDFYDENDDFIGWVRIYDNTVNYPVMYTPDDFDYYLHLDFNEKWSNSGTPFIGEGCTVDSRSFIIHGHNLRNGSMFAELEKYRSEEYWEGHQEVWFNTMDEDRVYRIFAAVDTTVDKSSGRFFEFYTKVGDLSDEKLASYVDELRARALYDTGVEVDCSDPDTQILVLSTCSYTAHDGRFLVAAVRERDDAAQGEAENGPDTAQ